MADKIKITFLGTGAMIPDDKRSHPAFLLSYKNENILIDCGEGTQVQFRKAKLNPCKLTRILITHWHGDHTFGLPGLLRTLSTSGYNKKLYMYGPKGFRKHMGEMFKAFGGIGEFKIEIKEVSGKFLETEDFYIEAEKMVHVQPCNAYNFVLKEKTRIDKNKLKKFKIQQGPHLNHLKKKGFMLYGGKKHRIKDLSFSEAGKKISFVLDTSVNKKIVPFAKNSDLLISEATFSKAHEKLAKDYQHLTAPQAASIAKTAKVKKLVITHLSQRYGREEERILEEARRIFRNTSLPKDLEYIYV